MWGITLSNPDDPHYTSIAYQQGYNARKDTLYDFLRDSDGNKVKDTNGVYLYKELYAEPGVVGGERQYHAVTVFQDTIKTFYYDNRAIKRDARSGDPVVRRAVMVNFNPGYLIHRAAAEQIIYDAVMYASTTHLIGKTLPESMPPEPLDVVAARKAAHVSELYQAKRKQNISGVYTLNGRFVPIKMHSIRAAKKMIAPGVYLLPNNGKKKLLPVYLTR
jgi:hypothetical protein